MTEQLNTPPSEAEVHWDPKKVENSALDPADVTWDSTPGEIDPGEVSWDSDPRQPQSALEGPRREPQFGAGIESALEGLGPRKVPSYMRSPIPAESLPSALEATEATQEYVRFREARRDARQGRGTPAMAGQDYVFQGVPEEAQPEHISTPTGSPPKKLTSTENYILSQLLSGQTPDQIKAELGGLKEPWLNPVDASAAAFGGGAVLGWKAAEKVTAKILKSLARGILSAIPAATMEHPIGIGAEMLAQENPALAFLFAVSTGLASGLTIENLAERKVLHIARNLSAKYKDHAKVRPLFEKLRESTPREEAQKIFEDWKTKEAPPIEETATQAEKSLTGTPTRMRDGYILGGDDVRGPDVSIREEDVDWNWSPVKDMTVAEQVGETPEMTARRIEIESGQVEITEMPRVAKVDTRPDPQRALTELERDGLQGLKDELKVSQGPHLKVMEPGAGEGGGSIITRQAWGNPSWFQELVDEKQVTKKQLYRIIDKAMAGEKLTPKQAMLRDDLLNAMDAEWSRHLSPEELEIKETHGWSGLEAELGKGNPGSRLYLHPATIAGPLGGLAAGVDWEAFKKDGTIRIDPKRALLGAFAGIAGVPLAKRTRKLGGRIANSWDEKFAAPFLEWAGSKANGLIVHEEIRHALGLGRSRKFQDLMRGFKRDTETSLNDAVRIGQELQEIAPTQVEQRRLMQIIRGGVTANAAMAAKAERVRALFAELRDGLKEHQLLEYSRFDKLTRAERTRLRRHISGPDPFKMDNLEALKEYASGWFGLDSKSWLMKHGNLKDLQGAIAREIEFERGRLNDFYHFGSAQEYAPIYFSKTEGLTPDQKTVLQDEIDHLKRKSRRGNPEGKQELEHTISALENMLAGGKEARRAFRSTNRALNLAYSHRRMDMPESLLKILGKISEAPYPVAKMAAVQKGDILKAQLFSTISDNPEWVIKPGPRTRADDIPANFTKIDDERFGALDGLFIRKDVWADLKEVEEWRGFFVQKWDQTLGLWKYGKVVLNPATHMRNTMSNFMLAYLGDVNPTDVKTYTKAATALRKGEADQFYTEAEEWGLFNNTFISSEISKFRDELAELRDPGALKNWVRRAMSLPADLYQGNEKLFKMAVFIKARDGGATVDEAAQKAEHFLFNYSDIPPWVKQMKRWVSPFFTFTYKAIPLFAEMAIRKPWKVGAIMAAMYGTEEFSKHKLGLSDEEASEQRALLPDWQRRKAPPGIGPYSHVLMPFKDSYGNNLYLDTAYILPYGNIAEKWGQSPLPLGDLLPSNPVFQFAASVLTNVEPFSGKPIYDELIDGYSQIAAKYLEIAWRDLAPSMAPGGYGFDKVKTGFMNTFMGKDVRDWADRPIEFQTAILSSLFGIKLSPANEYKLKQFEASTRRRLAGSVSKRKNELKRKLDRNEITRPEYESQVRDLLELKKKLLQDRPDLSN